jgi:hypothetical protein
VGVGERLKRKRALRQFSFYFFSLSYIFNKMAQGSKTKKPGNPKQKGGREKMGIMKKGCMYISFNIVSKSSIKLFVYS